MLEILKSLHKNQQYDHFLLRSVNIIAYFLGSDERESYIAFKTNKFLYGINPTIFNNNVSQAALPTFSLLALRLCFVLKKVASVKERDRERLNAINNSLNKYKSKWMSHSTKRRRMIGETGEKRRER